MWNAGLDEAQTGIKIAERNINNFRYADDTTLMTESKEELKGLLMKVKDWRVKKIGLQFNKCKTRNYKTPRGKYGQNTFWHKSQQILYDPPPKVMEIKAKINKWDKNKKQK